MTTDYRTLCEQLMELVEGKRYDGSAVVARARALLDQPVAEGPTDEEVTLTYAYAVAAAVGNKRGPFKPEDAEAAQLAGLRAVLARWPPPKPPNLKEQALEQLMNCEMHHTIELNIIRQALEALPND